MTLTPERRQEIETMVEDHGDVLVFRNRRVTPSQMEPCSSIIRELLAEIDRLTKRDQEYTQYQMQALRRIGAEYILSEDEVSHPHE